MAARYLSTPAFLCTSQTQLCNLANASDPRYSRNFSDETQVAHYDYPEYAAPKKQKPVPTAIGEAIEPVISSTSPLRRRLGDMNAFTFWLLIAVIGIVIIAASVGGAVGGTASARENQTTAKTATLRYFGSHYFA